MTIRNNDAARAALMQETIKLLGLVVQQTTFDAGHLGTLSPDKLRDLYRYEKLQGGLSARSAEPNVPEHLLEMLIQQIRPLLNRYMEPSTNHVGNGLVALMGGPSLTTIADFARILVRAAATLGPQRVGQLVFGWIEGKPLHYQTKVLLTGVTIDQPLALEEGIYITRLPKSSNELAAHLPAFSLSFHGSQDFINGVVLSIDCKAEPALYEQPWRGMFQSPIRHIWAQGKIPGFSLGSFCEALSLACNHYVVWKFQWPAYGDLQAFTTVGTGMSYVDTPSLRTRTSLSQEHMQQAREIHYARYSSGKIRPQLDTAINRWMRSKKRFGLLDQSIDLRIALEALYLKDSSGELRFRLATYGAWHLGTDPAERRKHHKTLLKAYALASRAVHAGVVKDIPGNRELLTTAQDLCRNGILKRLKEKRPPDWNEVILGARFD